MFCRSQFSACPRSIIKESEVPLNKSFSLRTIATAQSTGSGQGFFKCACRSKCESRKCACKKNNVLCNSRCHSALPCLNK